MVQILPQFDPFGDIGRSLGGGASQALGQLGQRQFALKGLEQLENLDPREFQGKPLHQQLAILSKAYAGTPLQAVLPDLLSTFIKERQRLSGGEPTDDISTGRGATPQGQRDSSLPFVGGRQASVDPEPYTEQDTPQSAGIQGQQIQDLPANAPRELSTYGSIFPNIKAMALRGNPQGISLEQKQSIIKNRIARGGTEEQGVAEAARTENYFREQAKIYQNLQDQAVEAIQGRYGNSTYFPMMQRAAQNEVERQINKGNLEPNSVALSALQKTRDIESAVNRAGDILGRPNFEFSLDARKSASKNWISRLAKDGEYQTAIELLMKKEIPVEGKTIEGPDWGPIRATEIVQEEANPQSVNRLLKEAEKLPNIAEKAPPILAPGRELERYAQERLKFPEKKTEGISQLANFIATKIRPEDSLVLLRNYANQRGYTEDDFSNALKIAKDLNPNLQFSDYQQWERENLIPLNIRPSLWELIWGKRSWGDRIVGKK